MGWGVGTSSVFSIESPLTLSAGWDPPYGFLSRSMLDTEEVMLDSGAFKVASCFSGEVRTAVLLEASSAIEEVERGGFEAVLLLRDVKFTLQCTDIAFCSL
jgi:hypothetical protein